MKCRFTIVNEDSLKNAILRAVLGVITRNKQNVNKIALMANVETLMLYLQKNFELKINDVVDLDFGFNNTCIVNIDVKVYELKKSQQIAKIEVPDEYMKFLFEKSVLLEEPDASFGGKT